MIRKARRLKKKQTEAEKLLERYNRGKISGLGMVPTAGYRLIQLLRWDSTNLTVKTLYRKCCQFKEKKEAINYTYYLLGSLFGYSILGAGAFFAVLGISLTLELGTRSLLTAGVVLAIFVLLGYLPYDNVNTVIGKRAEEIEQCFPRAVSQLALLTIAGMEVNQAWKLTSKGGSGTLYEEMTRVLTDLDNNVSTSQAYAGFLTRCSNKYTTKLATSIIQDGAKGNEKIAQVLRDLNDECWAEHKHSARRMGEKIQSKLLIPTIAMFIGIIILVIVPVVSGFSF